MALFGTHVPIFRQNYFPTHTLPLNKKKTKTRLNAKEKKKKIIKQKNQTKTRRAKGPLKSLCFLFFGLFGGPQSQVVTQQLHDQSGIFIVAVTNAI